MLRLSSPFPLFDYFRVPYERLEGWDAAAEVSVDPQLGRELQVISGDSGRIFWIPAASALPNRVIGRFMLDSIPIFGSLLPDQWTARWLDGAGSTWQRTTPIHDTSGRRVASIWADGDGDVLFPFDPGEIIQGYWSEDYAELTGSAARRLILSAARRSYYRLRPALPRRAQMLGRRLFSRIQSRTSFPAWPVETGLHDFYALMFEFAAGVAGGPLPTISPWPMNFTWAFVLTHDVETVAGYDNIDLMCDIEIASSYVSSWNFVPRNHHELQDDVLEKLRNNGFEIGVHGLYHDGRDIADLANRLPLIRQHAERWEAVGFRSPATLRDWEAMQRLGFDYDSSYFDTSPYEPQPGGCCSWLPYMIGDMVELPITLPQDHTLFEILGDFDERLWLQKARFLRERGGMALVLTHPDYADNETLVRGYRKLLGEFADDGTAWKALPRDVSAWWRRRSASRLERANGSWKIVGPAAGEARVAFVGGEA